MFNNYIIIDNILDDPYECVNLSKNINYINNDDRVYGPWRGHRSDLIHNINQVLFTRVFKKIVYSAFKKQNFTYSIESYFHKISNKVTYNSEEVWHVDNGLFAGVIYLNPLPEEKTGTMLNIDDNIINIENRFNRLLLYDANIRHAPVDWRARDDHTMRLTLSFFIHRLEFIF